jgi:isoleucyl-tRNA synthetase
MNFATRPTSCARWARSWSGYVYRGLKPVNWCFDCGSALAEAEVEYKDKATRRSTSASRSPSRQAGPPSAGRTAASRLDRDLDHHAVDHPVEPGAERAPGVEYALVDTPRGC